jgi:hypothetical protein
VATIIFLVEQERQASTGYILITEKGIFYKPIKAKRKKGQRKEDSDKLWKIL